MLKRIRIRQYKSFNDLEVRLPPLTVMFGPNGAGKSNFLDALQLLARLATSRTVKEAFDAPCRGKPLESFALGEEGIRGLARQDRLSFSLEADLHLSDTVIEAVDREIRELRPPIIEGRVEDAGETLGSVFARRDLRYRIAVEMLPRSGILRVADEYLAALNASGEPDDARPPLIERKGERLRLHSERGRGHVTYFDRNLHYSILSRPHYAPHYPHAVAVRHELESWLFFYLEPRERMRAANPVMEAQRIGPMGEELGAYLNTLKALDPRQFEAVEKALRLLMPQVDGIEVEVSDLGEVELRLRERGIPIPVRVLSEGTLRMLGLLALAGVGNAPALVGFEEPENGIHPRRIEMVAELLKTRANLGQTQYIVTTHSPLLPDMVPEDALLAVDHVDGHTRIAPTADQTPHWPDTRNADSETPVREHNVQSWDERKLSYLRDIVVRDFELPMRSVAFQSRDQSILAFDTSIGWLCNEWTGIAMLADARAKVPKSRFMSKSVASLRDKIEDVYGLPRGTVVVLKPDGSRYPNQTEVLKVRYDQYEIK